jgi:hypothetical protein
MLVLLLLTTACGSSPTSPTTTTSPTSESWSTAITPGGTASRTFTASSAGTVTVTLAATTVPLGFGVGVPGTSGCRLSASRVDVAGATLSVSVDQGDYCVQVYDMGNLAAQSSFTLLVTHP